MAKNSDACKSRKVVFSPFQMGFVFMAYIYRGCILITSFVSPENWKHDFICDKICQNPNEKHPAGENPNPPSNPPIFLEAPCRHLFTGALNKGTPQVESSSYDEGIG